MAIVAGDSARSELFRRISSDDKAIRMPPPYAGSEMLSQREIDLVRRWIDSGAQWQTHWSFIPPKRPEAPEVGDEAWARTPIDKFILQRLQREGLRQSPEADRPTLIRRVTLDLTGLPPTPEEPRCLFAIPHRTPTKRLSIARAASIQR